MVYECNELKGNKELANLRRHIRQMTHGLEIAFCI